MRGSYSEQVWMTLVALAYLNLALFQLRSSWVLVAKKAEKWLAAQQLQDITIATTKAQEFINAFLKI